MAEQMDLVKISFKVSGLDTKFHVQQMTGTEGISQLFHFELTLATGAEVPFAQVVGKKATLVFKRVSHGKNTDVFTRRVHGIVGRFQRVKRDQGGKSCVFRALLVPDVARSLHRTDCRIFQNETMEEVVGEVLKRYQNESNHLFSKKRHLPPRDYCVQYSESDWQFISRLLEQEGYYYFFDQGKDGATLLITNRANLPWPIAPGAEADEAQGAGSKPPRPVLYQPPTGQQPASESVYELSFGSQICPGQQQLDDYFFQQQNVSLQSTQTAKPAADFKDYLPADQKLEQYEYPGIYQPEEAKFLDKADTQIKAMAELRLQGHRVKALEGEGRSTCIRFAAGCYFTLSAMDEDVFDNTDYLLTQVHHRAETNKNILRGGGPEESHCTYDNSFTCVPLSLPFRPPRRTPRPSIHGVQSAVVVGPQNEEIYTDEHGRVKVMFRWDRQARKKKKDKESTADCSCWIRVSQPWAGPRWGAIFLPRVGHEVLVSFEDGDPDRPIITGSVYHATNRTPYELPRHKTRSTIKSNSSPDDKGRRSNEIRFEDKKGAEQIYIHAQTNMDEVVGHNHTRTVRDDEKITIKKGDRSVHVLEGAHDSYVEQSSDDIVKGDRSVTVTEGSETKRVMKGEHLFIVNKDSKKIINEGHDKVFVKEGSSYLTVKRMRRVDVEEGIHKTTVRKADMRANILEGDHIIELEKGDQRIKIHKGDYLLTIKEGKLKIECGKSHLEMSNDGTIELKGAGGSITINATGIQVQASGGKNVDIN